MDLAFSGAGFMGCYYFGVVDCWKKYIPKERVNRAAGASAGSLIAAYYLLDLPLKNCLREIIGLTEEIRSRPLGVFDRNHQMVDMLPKLLDKLFPDDAHKQVSGRLHVCITRLKDMKKVIVSEFETKKDLLDALNCSCFIPVWSGNHVSTYKGQKYIDGGFTDNLPVFDENTIRICCFAGQTDISPTDSSQKEILSANILNTPLYFTMKNFRRGAKALWPPPASFTLDLIERGFHDTKQFILDNDLIQCESCYVNSREHELMFVPPNPTISPCASPMLNRAQKQLKINDYQIDATGYLEPGNCDPVNKRVSEKLKRSRSPDSMDFQLMESLKQQLAKEQDEKCSLNGKVPNILITSTNAADQENQFNIINRKISTTSLSSSSSPSSSPENKKDKRERKKSCSANMNTLSARRKSSLALNSSSMLAVEDRITFAPNLLPSCPPSPNLNRNCNECSRLRHAARNDHVEDLVRQAAESYFDTTKSSLPKEGIFKSTLASPLRWIKLLGTTHSYKLDQLKANY